MQSANRCCVSFAVRRNCVSSAPIACARVWFFLSLSAPILLGTSHVAALDGESFSDYSPPMKRAVSASLFRMLTSQTSQVRLVCKVGFPVDSLAVIRLSPPTGSKNESDAAGVRPVQLKDERDEGLLTQVCDGNSEALSLLFRRYARIVRGIAYRVLQDPSEADDLLQDIFLLIHSLCATFDASKGSARHWILQMAYRRAISRRRYLTSRRFYQWVDVDEAGELRDPHVEVDRLNERIDDSLRATAIDEAFACLSEDQRQTLRLYFFEGYALGEIAAKMGQSKGNVKHHYFRGLERLRKQISPGKLSSKSAV